MVYILIYIKPGTSNGANVQICDFNGNNAQKFKFVKSQITGIDVSKYQNTIDWSKVKNNVDYAMIRVGYRGYGTGKIVSDSNYSTNIKNALANGIRCGVYFFSQAINEAEGIEEAKWVINSVKGYKITYPIAIDTEWSSEEKNGRADNISNEARTQAIKGFCETIKNEGYIPMIYANRDWLLENLNMSELSQYDVWLAHYVKGAPQNKSNYTGKYTMWQYTSQAGIFGITGNVDMSICYKNY